jgi:hypothetical protein
MVRLNGGILYKWMKLSVYWKAEKAEEIRKFDAAELRETIRKLKHEGKTRS